MIERQAIQQRKDGTFDDTKAVHKVEGEREGSGKEKDLLRMHGGDGLACSIGGMNRQHSRAV